MKGVATSPGFLRGEISALLGLLLTLGCGAGPGAPGEERDAADGGTRADGGISADGGPPRDGGSDGGCVPHCQSLECGHDGCGARCLCPPHLACDAPAELCRTEARVTVTTRDGVALATTVYLPTSAPPPRGHAVLMERSPYHQGPSRGVLESNARAFQSMGYIYVAQHCRGTGQSAGAWEPWRYDEDDGADLASWVVAQPWFTGKLGALGCSYSGYTALAAAAGSPHVAVVLADGPGESWATALNGGTVDFYLLSWLRYVDQGRMLSTSEYDQATNALAPLTLDESLLGGPSAYWRMILGEPTPIASYWRTYGMEGSYGTLCAPVLMVDNGEPTSSLVWRHLSSEGCQSARAAHRLLLSPGGHCHHFLDWLAGNVTPTVEKIRGFLDHYLHGSRSALVSAAQVHYRTQDAEADAFQQASSFPPPEAAAFTLYLHGQNLLGDTAPPLGDPEDSLLVDPQNDNPCDPSYDKYLYYLSDPLAEDWTLVGRPTVKLWASGTGGDQDYFVYLADYQPGESHVLSSGRARGRYRNGYAHPSPIQPRVPYELTIEAEVSTAYRIPAGHHLLLWIAGAACGYPENPHTGEPLHVQTHRQPSTHRVYHDAARPSRLLLQVIR